MNDEFLKILKEIDNSEFGKVFGKKSVTLNEREIITKEIITAIENGFVLNNKNSLREMWGCAYLFNHQKEFPECISYDIYDKMLTSYEKYLIAVNLFANPVRFHFPRNILELYQIKGELPGTSYEKEMLVEKIKAFVKNKNFNSDLLTFNDAGYHLKDHIASEKVNAENPRVYRLLDSDAKIGYDRRNAPAPGKQEAFFNSKEELDYFVQHSLYTVAGKIADKLLAGEPLDSFIVKFNQATGKSVDFNAVIREATKTTVVLSTEQIPFNKMEPDQKDKLQRMSESLGIRVTTAYPVADFKRDNIIGRVSFETLSQSAKESNYIISRMKKPIYRTYAMFASKYLNNNNIKIFYNGAHNDFTVSYNNFKVWFFEEKSPMISENKKFEDAQSLNMYCVHNQEKLHPDFVKLLNDIYNCLTKQKEIGFKAWDKEDLETLKKSNEIYFDGR